MDILLLTFIFRKHKFTALLAKLNFHSSLELRLFIFFYKFHLTYTFSDLGLGFRLVSSVEGKTTAVEKPSQSCVAMPGVAGLTSTLLAGLPSS